MQPNHLPNRDESLADLEQLLPFPMLRQDLAGSGRHQPSSAPRQPMRSTIMTMMTSGMAAEGGIVVPGSVRTHASATASVPTHPPPPPLLHARTHTHTCAHTCAHTYFKATLDRALLGNVQVSPCVLAYDAGELQIFLHFHNTPQLRRAHDEHAAGRA